MIVRSLVTIVLLIMVQVLIILPGKAPPPDHPNDTNRPTLKMRRSAPSQPFRPMVGSRTTIKIIRGILIVAQLRKVVLVLVIVVSKAIKVNRNTKKG